MLAVQALIEASRDSPDSGYGECPICLEIMEKPFSTECDHTFCYECIVGLINSNNRSSAGCPMCRRTLTIKNIRPAPLLITPPALLSIPLVAPAQLEAAACTDGVNVGESVSMHVVGDVTFDDLSAEAANDEVTPAAEGAAATDSADEAPLKILENGLMTTKLRHLVSELRKVQTADSTAKCLVFSQFTQVPKPCLSDPATCHVCRVILCHAILCYVMLHSIMTYHSILKSSLFPIYLLLDLLLRLFPN